MAVLMLLVAPLAAQDSPPPDEPLLQVDFPETEAIPGQPLSLRITVLVPTFMPEPPVWPTLEARNLLVRLPEGSTSPTSKRVGGQTWSGVSRHYRLSPMVPGEFSIPPQDVIVTYADSETNAPTRVTLTSEPLSFSGILPPDAEGLEPFVAAGSLELTQNIEGDPAAMKPGDSVIRTVVAEVGGVSPMFLPDLLPPTDVAGIAAYPDEPVLEDLDNRGDVSGTRTERVTLVAEGGGRGEAPRVTLKWYNLESGEVETATAEGFAIAVDGPPLRRAAPRDWRFIALSVVVGVLALGVCFRLWLWLAPPLRRWRQERRAARLASEEHAYRQLRGVVARREHAALRPALDTWAAKVDGFDPRGYAPVQQALTGIGAARYGRQAPDDAGAAWQALGSALSAARDALRGKSDVAAALPPLNPGGEPCAPASRAAHG